MQTLIFERYVNEQTDIYSVLEDGTELTPLATSPEDESFVGLIPGERVLFRLNNALYSVLLDGSGLTKVIEPYGELMNIDDGIVELVQGRLILLQVVEEANGFHTDIVSIFPDGTDAVTLGASEDDEFFAGVTKSGRVILERDAGDLADVYAVNIDGTQLRALAATELHETFAGTVNDHVIITVQESTTSQRDILLVAQDGSSEPLANTADDERVVVDLPSGEVVFTRNNDLYVANALTLKANLLAGGPNNEVLQYLTPSGTAIFMRHPPLDQNSDIYAVSLSGGQEVELAATASREVIVGVTQDGRAIYSEAPIDQGASGIVDIHSVRLDGTDRFNLTSSPQDDERVLAITAGGEIIFVRVGPSGSGIMRVNADGMTPPSLLLPDGEFFAVSVNGRVMYTIARGEESELWSVRLDGTDARLLADGPYDQDFVAISGADPGSLPPPP